MSQNHFLPLFLYLIFVSLPRSLAQHGGETVVTELWCVAKNNADDAALQGALDWACGPGGTDCSRIQQGGPCYDPSDVQKTASYAFNDYYLKHGMTDDACSFSNNTVNNASISQSTGTLGMGPDTADLSASHRSAHSWLRQPLIVASFFLSIVRILS
ncbi:hypothetical protein GOBAR_DD00392 [Gossypium barbadense]|nr:hypothetical protein GOBAR_DD00392 [Gossypium barbadense]